ncbi:hypothetical protein CIPAW_16G015100 [Carya illinoinensis]|uniref:TIR domain-containing protein n=3 Tax=Carya illinoinensis TaxID=32201 RepID=A0A8T1N1H4_CARIL|nr:hypothetical protein CIPAW_16G015100 [Carya illinoinensis]
MAVIIISKEYASSTWCLEELAKIVECMNDREMNVVPIFYHVEPSDVRHQKGAFGDAFAQHEKNPENKEKVQTWKNALKEMANHTGRHLKTNEDDEPMFIKSIVERISRKVKELIRGDPEYNLVGMDSHLMEMDNHLNIETDDHPRFVGICGMSGMGKTTLARVIFRKFKRRFQAVSFIENVSSRSKENGLVALQENLLSDMKLKDDEEKWDVLKGINVTRNRLRDAKVLIVLDDVDEREQLETLAGNCNWFGRGSRIIVTTKDRQLLKSHGVENIYPIKGLQEREALQLFCQEAFHNNSVQFRDQNLCNGYVSYAEGHPLTLKRLGFYLRTKGGKVWSSLLARLQEYPDQHIQEQLEKDYDALAETEKKMFLDIACFFHEEDQDRVLDLLEASSGYRPTIDIVTLEDKSLITILEKKLWMHSLLQRTGREIVRCEDREEPGKRSRLWRRDDIFEVLRENSGTKKVQGIMLSLSSPRQKEDLNPEAFSNMKKLRLIKICGVNLPPRGLDSLSNWLRLMEWHQYSLGCIPESFQPSNLVELIMHRSSFVELPMAFLKLKKLKVMDFSGSEKLMMTPDFSGCPSLQKLIFEGCTKLSEVHPSIGALDRLILLNLKECKKLLVFPSAICCLPALKTLILSGTTLSLQNFFSGLTSLVALDLSDCNLLDGALPDDLNSLSSLESLNLSRNNFTCLPGSISQLPKLKSLCLDNCSGLQLLPNLPSTTLVMTRECTSLPNFSNQVVGSTSGGGESTVINCHSEVSSLYPHCQPPGMEEQIHQNDKYHGMPQTGIPSQYDQECPSRNIVSNELGGLTSAGGSTSDDMLREASGVGSARKRKMGEAFGQGEMAKEVRFDKPDQPNAD